MTTVLIRPFSYSAENSVVEILWLYKCLKYTFRLSTTDTMKQWQMWKVKKWKM